MADPQALSLLWQLFATTQRVKSLLGAALTDAPLSADEYAVYSLLADEGPLAPTELARELGMPATTMSHYVRALAERRHAERVPNPSDGRSYLLSLTDSGRAVHRDSARRFERANERFRAALATDEAQLRAALVEVGRAADAAARELALPAGVA